MWTRVVCSLRSNKDMPRPVFMQRYSLQLRGFAIKRRQRQQVEWSSKTSRSSRSSSIINNLPQPPQPPATLSQNPLIPRTPCESSIICVCSTLSNSFSPTSRRREPSPWSYGAPLVILFFSYLVFYPENRWTIPLANALFQPHRHSTHFSSFILIKLRFFRNTRMNSRIVHARIIIIIWR